jgi:hypothetical protein
LIASSNLVGCEPRSRAGAETNQIKLTVNLQTASALGLMDANSLLAIADKVIE